VAEPFDKLRLPYIMNLRRDPLERAEYNSNTYMDWMVQPRASISIDAGRGGGADRCFRCVSTAPKPASFNWTPYWLK